MSLGRTHILSLSPCCDLTGQLDGLNLTPICSEVGGSLAADGLATKATVAIKAADNGTNDLMAGETRLYQGWKPSWKG